MIGSIPWRKLVNAKKFLYCHGNVLSWDDTAGEEAFQNAKKRFWAEINGFHCGISLPDPDIYIDKIDWNPIIDPELIKELDREYFAPDDEENGMVWRKNKKTRNSAYDPSCESSKNIDDGLSRWECNNMPVIGTLEGKLMGWSQWNNNINGSMNSDNNDNPWECNAAQSNGNTKDNAWGDFGNKSWGCNWMQNHVSQPRVWGDDNNCGERDCQSFASVRNSGWGNSLDKSWGMNQHKSKNTERFDNPWKSNVSQDSRAPKDVELRDYGGDACCSKQWDHHNNQKKNVAFQRSRGGWGAWNEDGQKRDDAQHNMLGYRNLRFQVGDHQMGNNWRIGNNKKRPVFPMSSQ